MVLRTIRSSTQNRTWRLAALAMIGVGMLLAACAAGEEADTSSSEISEGDFGADLALSSRVWEK